MRNKQMPVHFFRALAAWPSLIEFHLDIRFTVQHTNWRTVVTTDGPRYEPEVAESKGGTEGSGFFSCSIESGW